MQAAACSPLPAALRHAVILTLRSLPETWVLRPVRALLLTSPSRLLQNSSLALCHFFYGQALSLPFWPASLETLRWRKVGQSPRGFLAVILAVLPSTLQDS